MGHNETPEEHPPAWHERMADAIIIAATLPAQPALAAAQHIAREYARTDQTVVLTAIGARSPFFWHVPAGQPLETAEPDVVLLILENKFSPTARLLLSTAHQIILITGTGESDLVESRELMDAIRRQSVANHIEIVIVSESQAAAKTIGGQLTASTGGRLSRVTWRRLPTQHIRQDREGTKMQAAQPMMLSDAENRSREWEENFKRAEEMLTEAKQALHAQLHPSPLPPPPQPSQPFARRAAL